MNAAIIVAIISGLSLIVGYWYRKHIERKSSIANKRREIYFEYLQSISKNIELISKIKSELNIERPSEIYSRSEEILLKYPKLQENILEQNRIKAAILLYGSDEIIKASNICSDEIKEIFEQDNQTKTPVDKLVLCMRKDVYPKSKLTINEINKFIKSIANS